MKLYVSIIMAAALTLSASAHAATNLITNGGFEDPNIGNTNYTYPGFAIGFPLEPATIGDWTYGGSALVNAQSSSAWYGGAPPADTAGEQFAALQGTSTLSQSFTTASPTSLDLSWTNAGRPNFGCCNGDQTYEVLVDSTLVGTYQTFSGTGFTPVLASLVGVGAGTHILTFQGLIAADETSFIDSVSVSAVPEPSSWVALLLGFFGVGFMLRKSRVAPALA